MALDLFTQGLNAHQAGHLDEAERLYREALEQAPRHIVALRNLGTVFLQRGELEPGVDWLAQSLALDPNQPAALNNWANGLMALGRLGEALGAYDKALELNPQDPFAHRNRARLLTTLERLDEALTAYDRALAITPDDPALLFDHGLLLHRLGRANGAMASLRRAVALKPDSAEAMNLIGVVLGDEDEDQALACYDRALALAPGYPDALNNKALILARRGQLDEAVALYDRAIALSPAFPAAHANRATALGLMHRLDEAVAGYDAAIALQPGLVDAVLSRADVLARLLRVDEAVAGYDQVLAFVPDHPFALANKGIVLLQSDRYAEGWPLMEARWDGIILGQERTLDRPLWLGETDVAGKTLLLHAEQGVGDTLMMLRYVPLLAQAGASVILGVQAPLEALAEGVEGVVALVREGEIPPPYDLHCPMMSLPLAFGTTLETIPTNIPYLAAPDDSLALWRGRMGPAVRPRIGLAWSGSDALINDNLRSIPLEQLQPLFDLDADLISLQADYRPADLRLLASGAPVIDVSVDLETFADTAALIEQLDLVITVDTAVAHLAGALGKPVWILVPHTPDFRWGLHRAHSPWYPTARLYRQPAPGDWETVIAKIRADAAALTG